MGYALCTGYCIGCGYLFNFNPMRVPSVRIKGDRKPICADCVASANPMRVKNGLPPIELLPGAYDACDESELY